MKYIIFLFVLLAAGVWLFYQKTEGTWDVKVWLENSQDFSEFADRPCKFASNATVANHSMPEFFRAQKYFAFAIKQNFGVQIEDELDPRWQTVSMHFQEICQNNAGAITANEVFKRIPKDIVPADVK